MGWGNEDRHLIEVKRHQKVEQELRARVAELEAEVERIRWEPLGDNHHNAGACPHCTATVAMERDAARAAIARVEAALYLLASDGPGEMYVLPPEHHACERQVVALAVKALRAVLAGAT